MRTARNLFVRVLGSWIMKKPFMKLMIEKQNPAAPDFLIPFQSLWDF